MDLFRTTMSLNRLQFLLICLRFDNVKNRKEKMKIDKLGAGRGILESFIENCKQSYTPSQYLPMDEKFSSLPWEMCI